MKLFIDSADIEEIKQAVDTGIVDGVTTNPSLLAKSKIARQNKLSVHDYYEKICALVGGDVSAEVIATDYSAMVEEGRELANISPNIVVKVPMTQAGIKAIGTLKEAGIRTNCTLIFSVSQALLAAKAGAFYISPFIGRLDDAGQIGNGMQLVEQICDVVGYYGFTTQVLAASIRSLQHVEQCAEVGADVATCPYGVLEAMFKHPLTDTGLKKFLSDYAEAKD
ncbi:MAG: fructose-6-phosphate aldolase [Chromatiales bacterium]|nr:fructose-6-phosphate aldolase [Chromatiales bacterium]